MNNHKQYYSIQLSHTFNYDNIVLPSTKIKTDTLKINSRDSYIIHEETFPAIYQVHNTSTEPSRPQVTQLKPLVALQVHASIYPLKLHRSGPAPLNHCTRDVLLINSHRVRRLPPQVIHNRAAICV